MQRDDVKEILGTLEALHEAQAGHDVDAVLAVYATDGFANLAGVRAYNEQLMEVHAFKGREVDLTHAECFFAGDTALLRPVLYRNAGKTRSFSYHFKRSDAGWRIADNSRSFLPGHPVCDARTLATAGHVIEHRGVMWTRRWDVPVQTVWDAVSTKEGLDRWWITQDVSLDLRQGGRFEHHWVNTIRDFEPMRHITFSGVPGDAAPGDAAPGDAATAQNVMRFGMRGDGEGTVFTFYDAFHAHPYPLSLPWTCAGWHGSLDALGALLTGSTESIDFGLGGEFYFDYLRDYALHVSEARTLSDDPAVPAADWYAAFSAKAFPVT